jgi:hypothetical protein
MLGGSGVTALVIVTNVRSNWLKAAVPFANGRGVPWAAVVDQDDETRKSLLIAFKTRWKFPE